MLENRYTVKDWCAKKRILDAVGREATAEQALDFLLGTPERPARSDFFIGEYSKGTTSVWHRLARIVLVPVLVSVLPIQWLITGSTGFRRNTRAGKVVFWLLGD